MPHICIDYQAMCTPGVMQITNFRKAHGFLWGFFLACDLGHLDIRARQADSMLMINTYKGDMEMDTVKAYKLFRVRRDGSLGPVIINRGARIPVGEWLECEDHSGKAKSYGVAVRVGFHACAEPVAPHLTKPSKKADADNRTWYAVELEGAVEMHRGVDGGSDWFVARRMRVVERVVM